MNINPYIDIPLFIIFALLFSIGWMKGFWRTLLGPLALIIGMIISYIYYFKTHNFLMSIIISIAAPFFINFLFTCILSLFPKKQNEKEISVFFLWGHLAGGILHTAWHGVIILLILMTIVILPINFSWLKNVRTEIKNSLTYTHLLSWTQNFLPGLIKDIESITRILENPENIERFRETPEYTDVMEDSRIKNIISDESLIEKIQNNNIIGVLKDNKIQEFMQDTDLIKKFFKLNEKIISEAKDNWGTPKSIFKN